MTAPTPRSAAEPAADHGATLERMLGEHEAALRMFRAQDRPASVEQTEGDVLALRAALSTLRASDAHDAAVRTGEFRPTHRHKKRGTEYEVLGEALLQTGTLLDDENEVIVYRGDDGKLWVRPPDEFNDGRFEELPAAPSSGEGA